MFSLLVDPIGWVIVLGLYWSLKRLMPWYGAMPCAGVFGSLIMFVIVLALAQTEGRTINGLLIVAMFLTALIQCGVYELIRVVVKNFRPA